MIDLARIRAAAVDVSPQQAFGSMLRMRPPRVSVRQDVTYFPPIQRPSQQFPDWWRLHEDPREAATESLMFSMLAMTFYPTKYALGFVHRPYLIASLGIKWGFSLMAFTQGARAAGVPDATVNGYDEEEGRPGSIEWFRQACIHERVPYNLGHSSAADYAENGIPLAHIDLFYISGNRTHIEYPRDIDLAVKTLSPRGIIVIEELGISEAIVNEWAIGHRFDSQLIDGLYILSR